MSHRPQATCHCLQPRVLNGTCEGSNASNVTAFGTAGHPGTRKPNFWARNNPTGRTGCVLCRGLSITGNAENIKKSHLCSTKSVFSSVIHSTPCWALAEVINNYLNRLGKERLQFGKALSHCLISFTGNWKKQNQTQKQHCDLTLGAKYPNPGKHSYQNYCRKEKTCNTHSLYWAVQWSG